MIYAYAVPLELGLLKVRLDKHNQPISLTWLGTIHQIEEISNAYRVTEGWLEEEVCRDYFVITTTSGSFMVIYHDLLSSSWMIEWFYD